MGVSSYRATFTSILVPLVTEHWLSDEKWLNLFSNLMISWFKAEPYILTDDSHSIIKLLSERGLLDAAYVDDLLRGD